MANWFESKGLSAQQAIDIPPFWLLGAMFLAWLQAVLLPGLTYGFGTARLLGIALALGGVALMFWSVMAFRRARTSVVPHQMPKRIITDGPFRISRNPIYLGDLMVLTGAILWWGAWPSVVLIPLFGWIIERRFIALEEARMKQNFASEFEEFAAKTPRWL